MANAQGTGSIYQVDKSKPKGKCRKWKLIVSLGRDPHTGKYRQKSQRFTGTYSEAQAALAELQNSVDAGDVVANSTYTLNQYIDQFLESRRLSGEVAEGTIRRESDKLKSLAYLIGNMKLQDITPNVLEKAYLELRSGNSKSGKCLSGTYLNDINKKVSLLMAHAKKNGVIATNPCDAVVKPKIDTDEKRALKKADIQALLDALNPSDHMQCAVILCTTLGLRRGEAVGLSWDDVDFSNNTIHVCHSYDDAGNLACPKTKASNRYLPMPEYVVKALLARLEVQKVLLRNYAPEKVETGPDGTSHLLGATPIISDARGERIHPSGLGHWWYKHRADYGLEGWTLHELRHTFLTLAAEQGVHPSVMQKLAGHSTARLTMEVYTHVNMEAQRNAMNSMDELFSKA